MKKTERKSVLNKSLIYGLVPLILFALWGVFTLLYITSYDKSFLILSYNHSQDTFTKVQHEKLLTGDKVEGEFTAAENNLGIVAVRFTIFSRVPYKDEDKVVFRIKEKGAKDWYYQNNYRAGLIYDVPVFPFGFPKILDSQGKQYVFEIQSLEGNQRNAVAVSRREPVIISKYETSKAFLLSDKKEFVYFTLKKFNALKTAEVLYVSFIFLLPLIIHFLLITPQGEKVSGRFNTFIYSRIPKQIYSKSKILFDLTYIKVFLLSLLLVMILSDIFIFQITYAAVYIVLIGIWIYILAGEFKSKISFIVSGLFLVLSSTLYYIYYEHLAELTAAWAFLFLCAGLIHALIEYKNENK